VGNGATIQCTGTGGFAFWDVSNVDLSGFTFSGDDSSGSAGIQLQQGSGYLVHDNVFANFASGIYVYDQDGSHIDNNTFDGGTSAIYGYPGSNDTFDHNAISKMSNDGIHLANSTNTNIDVSYNAVTLIDRIPIEIQTHTTGLTINHNYVQVIQPTCAGCSWMAISCATGPEDPPDPANEGQNIEIAYNSLFSSIAGAGSAIEIMGNLNLSIHDNYGSGWGSGVLDGAIDDALTETDNIWIASTDWTYDSISWGTETPPAISGDQVVALSAASPPAIPATDPAAPSSCAP
jgi:parallel beta-helix repeat protein